jgi:Zn ribbon nucleic-acid-binding protein
MNKAIIGQCATAVSLFRGLYARVANKLGVDVSYVSRIAHGERKSKVAEKVLTKEFNKVVAIMRNGSVLSGEKVFIVVALVCPRCKTQQNVHIAVHSTFTHPRGERCSCINCGHHFKVTVPTKIVRGPFPV